MHDARVWRHHGELAEGALAPAQEGVALAIAFELALGVDAKCVPGAERIDLHRVVDHQLGGHERVYCRGVAPHRCHRVSHGSEIDDGGYACEVLHQHARGRKRDLAAGLRARVPAG